MGYREIDMKVMWLCNTPTANAAKVFGINAPVQGGWLIRVSEEMEIKEDIEFAVVVPGLKNEHEVIYEENNGSMYVTLNSKFCDDETLIETFSCILDKLCPDIIHIWGTEYKHSWAMVMAAKKRGMLGRVVVSIQGLVGMIAQHYMGGIPGIYQILPSARDAIRKDTLKKQQKNLVDRGNYERAVLECVHHVIGRTFWDEACVKFINPEIQYHFNNETLRESFYECRWEYEKCEKHRIFVSQSHYPIKGFHYLLKAAAMLKERYDDLLICISGYDNALKTGILKTAYGKYIQYLIKKYELSSRIQYVGMLNEEEMRNHFLKSEIFVSPSVIENSPNSVGEAMLLGMPVVASNVGGVATMLKHNKEGFLYQADAPYLLAYYISRFFDDKELEKEFGKNARCHAMETHDKSKNVNDLIEIYEKITEGR